MKTPVKSLLLLAGVIVLAAPLIRAEDAPPPPPPDHPGFGPGGPEGHGRRGPGAMLERLAKKLNLTPDQEAKWKDLAQQERSALEAIRADTSLSRQDKWPKAMETRKNFLEQRRAVLTADQQKQFDEMQAKMKQRMQERRERRENDPDAPARPDAKPESQ